MHRNKFHREQGPLPAGLPAGPGHSLVPFFLSPYHSPRSPRYEEEYELRTGSNRRGRGSRGLVGAGATNGSSLPPSTIWSTGRRWNGTFAADSVSQRTRLLRNHSRPDRSCSIPMGACKIRPEAAVERAENRPASQREARRSGAELREAADWREALRSRRENGQSRKGRGRTGKEKARRAD